MLRTRLVGPAVTAALVTLDLMGATVALAATPARWLPRAQPMELGLVQPLQQAQVAQAVQVVALPPYQAAALVQQFSASQQQAARSTSRVNLLRIDGHL